MTIDKRVAQLKHFSVSANSGATDGSCGCRHCSIRALIEDWERLKSENAELRKPQEPQKPWVEQCSEYLRTKEGL